ncbi:MAG: hypothetical protein Q7J85_12130 [Bacillota bacterium]|nr:hypothetical protein [Bacillota bacterium]
MGQLPIILVQENHAHAWVEVFLSGYGWVAFETTQPFEILDVFGNDRSARIQNGQQEEEPADEFEGFEEGRVIEPTEEANEEELISAVREFRESEEEIQTPANDPVKTFPHVVWAFLLAGAFFFAASFTIYHELTHIKDPVEK